MLKFGAGISPRGGVDFDGITEQKPQYVEMMNAHVEQRKPVIRGQKGLPMRYCTHLDRSQNRRSQLILLEQLLENAHRLIEPQFLVDRYYLVSCLRFFNARLRKPRT